MMYASGKRKVTGKMPTNNLLIYVRDRIETLEDALHVISVFIYAIENQKSSPIFTLTGPYDPEEVIHAYTVLKRLVRQAELRSEPNN
jgi:hypothetical protein